MSGLLIKNLWTLRGSQPEIEITRPVAHFKLVPSVYYFWITRDNQIGSFEGLGGVASVDRGRRKFTLILPNTFKGR